MNDTVCMNSISVKDKPWPRMIALVDMNAFFASIEQLDRPQWQQKPVCVTNGRTGTCIITASYEARARGIKTGMRLREARGLAPDLIQAPSRPYRYAQISSSIMAALESITPEIEVFSVDEAFLDLTGCQSLYDCPVAEIGRRIKACVFEASGLLCSVGISGDKSTAKWAAKQQKPDGLTIVHPYQARETLSNVLVTDLCGVGSGIGRYLAQYGVHRCGDMQKVPISVLGNRFGNLGKRIWLMAQGMDPEPLHKEVGVPQSIGHGKVIPPNTRDKTILRTYLLHMCEKVAARLRRYDFEARLFAIGMNTPGGWVSKKLRTTTPTSDGDQIMALADFFLDVYWDQGERSHGVHQVHVGALDPQTKHGQGELFTEEDAKKEKLLATIDEVNHRYGEFALCKALLLNRSEMPNVISPAWRPAGPRNTLES
ncbi:DNA polymerase IV [Endozoicomonas sp. 8E]|uniref:DNA polymerase Y family protein n=1 Tax=Endozoicomonas sp. 8E TaxID=3035692 RepID=UPI00293906B2|nr:DNA polymerase IV [Endozoicomonas sp. 8E]WOG29441.1 DNA polymerase IV [Endozoicomonas sp. 8E]